MREKAEALMNAVYKEENAEKIKVTREMYTDLCFYIMTYIKDSREKSLALTKLEESCMWAIKSITREKEEPVNISIPTPNIDNGAITKTLVESINKQAINSFIN